uniref:Uncharacterized protein n=1 Tax=Rhodopseudomonas palustris (strain BisA53) TaxID=316055 RepID=Q07JQ8_RHOP5
MRNQTSTHFSIDWAKERLDEMDVTVTSLEGKLGSVQADARDKAGKLLAQLRNSRDGFWDLVKGQAEAGEAGWSSAKTKLDSQWATFESQVETYVESVGSQVEIQQETFQLQAAAQLKAWREAADKLGSAANDFAAERRGEIDATVKRMADAAVVAEETLQKLSQAGTQSWSVLRAALAETRGTFDRANQAVRDEFKRAV